MMISELLDELARRGILLVANGDRLRFHPRDAMTPELLEQLKSHKAEVLAVMDDPWPTEDEPWPEPCPKCFGLELWETMTGRWRCMKCDPPCVAVRALKKAERLRKRYGLPDPP